MTKALATYDWLKSTIAASPTILTTSIIMNATDSLVDKHVYTYTYD